MALQIIFLCLFAFGCYDVSNGNQYRHYQVSRPVTEYQGRQNFNTQMVRTQDSKINRFPHDHFDPPQGSTITYIRPVDSTVHDVETNTTEVDNPTNVEDVRSEEGSGEEDKIALFYKTPVCTKPVNGQEITGKVDALINLSNNMASYNHDLVGQDGSIIKRPFLKPITIGNRPMPCSIYGEIEIDFPKPINNNQYGKLKIDLRLFKSSSGVAFYIAQESTALRGAVITVEENKLYIYANNMDGFMDYSYDHEGTLLESPLVLISNRISIIIGHNTVQVVGNGGNDICLQSEYLFSLNKPFDIRLKMGFNSIHKGDKSEPFVQGLCGARLSWIH